MRGGCADLTVAGGDLGGVGEALTGDMPLVGGDGGVGIAGDRAAVLLIGKNAETCATARRTLAVTAAADRHSKGHDARSRIAGRIPNFIAGAGIVSLKRRGPACGEAFDNSHWITDL
jgi:hypothetical protein